ncbi:hypothetical protein CDD81_5509 [Ophiocordyceps australis]|uniref:Nucleoporin Nup54 alpha-helical domain-containing protein n=1 Tax=Ophiocordyceps australis TaxID=1399860 RepID=A0A2C5Y9W0_9HYPO|nr:hypothetical protein CDD81_5509 [Ophiocordyceps australis]
MSLSRSLSGPSGLTINTDAANSVGTSFAQQPATGGLFGAAPTTSTTNNTMAAPSVFSGLQQQKPASGLFGASNATAAQPSLGGGLFANSTAQQQPAATGSLFSTNTGSAQQQAAQQPSGTTGLFASAGIQPQQQPQQQQQQQPSSLGTGLFGKPAATSTQPASGTSMFTQPQQQPPSGLYGQPQQQPINTSGLFGQSQQQPSSGLFGQSQQQQQPSSLFGQSQQQPNAGSFGQNAPQNMSTMNQVPAVQINYDNLRQRTRFDDLTKPAQDEIALIDKGIQRVIKMKDEIGEFMPQHGNDIEQLGRDVKFVESKFRTVQVALNRDIQTVKTLQDITKKNIADAQLSFKATDNLKLPTHYHQTGLFASSTPPGDANASGASSTHANTQDLISYFNRVCDDVERYKKRLDDYRAEIERDMPGVENGLYEQIRALRDRNSAAGGAVPDQLTQVLSALRETGNAIVAQAGRIADTREKLSRLQAGMVDSGAYATGTFA